MNANIKSFLLNLFTYQKKDDYEFSLPQESEITDVQLEKFNNTVSNNISDNLETIKVKYNSLINSDIQIREFTLLSNNINYKAFLVYIDGMVNDKNINESILSPLMLRNRANTYSKNKKEFKLKNDVIVRKVRKNNNLQDYILDCLLPQNSVKKTTDYSDILLEINSRKLRNFCRYFKCSLLYRK